MINDYKVKTGSELSDYQKRIENIENVILCVSEAEKMIRQIGLDLLSDELELPQKKRSFRHRCGKSFVGFRSDMEEPAQSNTTNRFMRKKSGL